MSDTSVFDRAAALLPASLRAEALFLPEQRKLCTEEIRLRCGQGAWLCAADGDVRLNGAVGVREIDETVERATKCSLYAAEESMRAGYFTADGGYRLGFGGSMIVRGGEPVGFRRISSVAVRIPRAVACVDDGLFERLRGKSVLIYSAPGVGKTTFLRELVRRTSEEGIRVSLVDERGELAALAEGRPQFDVGSHTDVMEGCPKAVAAEMLLRTMSPRVLAMDELSAADIPPLRAGIASGVRLLATVHAAGLSELRRRGIPTELFDAAVSVTLSCGRRVYEAEELPW